MDRIDQAGLRRFRLKIQAKLINRTQRMAPFVTDAWAWAFTRLDAGLEKRLTALNQPRAGAFSAV